MPDTLVDANIMSALPVFCEKIVFVGDARSGKSSVIDRCMQQQERDRSRHITAYQDHLSTFFVPRK